MRARARARVHKRASERARVPRGRCSPRDREKKRVRRKERTQSRAACTRSLRSHTSHTRSGCHPKFSIDPREIRGARPRVLSRRLGLARYTDIFFPPSLPPSLLFFPPSPGPYSPRRRRCRRPPPLPSPPSAAAFPASSSFVRAVSSSSLQQFLRDALRDFLVVSSSPLDARASNGNSLRTSVRASISS